MTAFIDSSAWIDYFHGEKSAAKVNEAIQSGERIVTSSLNLLEVYFKYLKLLPAEADDRLAFVCSHAEVVAPDKAVVTEAARLRIQRGLATVDAIVWATAEKHGARLLTSDRDFKGYKPLELLR